MYKVIPTQPLQLKTYWCADLQVANEIAIELRARYGCEYAIINIPSKRIWSSNKSPSQTFKLASELEFNCSPDALNDALYHVRGNVAKIKDAEEIFCFAADDLLWQTQYFHETTIY